MSDQPARPVTALSVLLFIGGFAVCAFILFFWAMLAIAGTPPAWRTLVALCRLIPMAVRDSALGVVGAIAGAYAIRRVVQHVNRRHDPLYSSLPDDPSDDDAD